MTVRSFILAAGLLAVASTRPVAQFEPIPGLSRVRVIDARTADTVRKGLERSSIVRELVASVEAGKDFVYIGIDDALPSCLVARMTLMGARGEYRYLRISLSRDLRGPAAVAAMAHELQHVREVQAHPEIRDDAALLALYRRIGHRSIDRESERWDTAEARRIGLAVRRELIPSTTIARAK